MGYTISQILDDDVEYDHLFWATYSIEPNVVDFLFTKDLRHCLSKPYFHLICDKSKFDLILERGLESMSGRALLSRMQSYAMISSQRLEGSFHPKIMFFSSDSQVRCILLSGNATASGILSNQDLIAEFKFVTSEPDDEQKRKLASIYQFISQFEGWSGESRTELIGVGEQHPWLNELSSEEVIYSKPNKSLYDQMIESIRSLNEVKRVIVFSPFFDEDLKALRSFCRDFPMAKIQCYTPSPAIEVRRPELELPENLSIYSASVLQKRKFHAKYFAFLAGKECVAFWGSANCSYSALMSANRNREILVRTSITEESIEKLWPGTNAKGHELVELRALRADPAGPDTQKVEIVSGAIDETGLELCFAREFKDSYLYMITKDGLDELIGPYSTTQCRVRLEFGKVKELCGVYVADRQGSKLSAAHYLNNFIKIRNSVDSNTSDSRLDLTDREAAPEKKLRELYNFFGDVALPSSGLGARSSAANLDSAVRFWKLSKYQGKGGAIGLFGYRERVDSDIRQREDSRESDDDTDESTNVNKTSKKRYDPRPRLSWLSKIGSRLFTMVEKSKDPAYSSWPIIENNWLKGFAIAMLELRRLLDDEEVLSDELAEEIGDCLASLVPAIIVVVHSVSDALKKNNDEDLEEFIGSVLAISDLFLALRLYSYHQFVEENGVLDLGEEHDDFRDRVADAQFVAVRSRLLASELYGSETVPRKLLALDEIKHLLRAAKPASLSVAAIRRLKVLDPTDLNYMPGDIVLLNSETYLIRSSKESEKCRIKPFLGVERIFLSSRVEPRVIYRFASLIR